VGGGLKEDIAVLEGGKNRAGNKGLVGDMEQEKALAEEDHCEDQEA